MPIRSFHSDDTSSSSGGNDDGAGGGSMRNAAGSGYGRVKWVRAAFMASMTSLRFAWSASGVVIGKSDTSGGSRRLLSSGSGAAPFLNRLWAAHVVVEKTLLRLVALAVLTSNCSPQTTQEPVHTSS